MTNLDTSTTFEVGIAKVDAEHRHQVELIHQLSKSEATMIDLLGKLHSSFTKHFAYEEAIMRAQCYDEYDGHQADHQRLLDEITTAMFDCRSGEQNDNARAANKLAESFGNHILEHDQRFYRQINTVEGAPFRMEMLRGSVAL